MTTHTPAPWRYMLLRYGSGIGIVDSTDVPEAERGYGMDRVADCWHEGNARLISAAPDLLSACQRQREVVLGLFEAGAIPPQLCKLASDIDDEVQEALEKAGVK